VLLLILQSLALSGCTAVLQPISGVPAHRLPAQFHASRKNDLVPIELYRLRQQPPADYLLDSGDILGIYIEEVLGTAETPPPILGAPEGSNLPPALGYPIPARQDGTITLPLVPPINVRGLTLRQVEELIRRAYTVDRRILLPGKDRIMVTLMRERTYRIIVVREDGGIGGGQTEKSSRGQIINLPAYNNDVLHALAETGGLPGLDVKNEVKILKGKLVDARKRDAFIREFYRHYSHHANSCLCVPPLPDDPSIIRIPLRIPPGAVPNFRPEDVILENGDIVYVESRDREVFYTGGLLGGGEHPLPRDYDLDVLRAMALVGPGFPSGGQSGGGGGIGGGGGLGGGIGGLSGVTPSQLFIYRTTPCGDQIIIAVDLNRAARDPRSRPLIQPNDMLVLRYKPREELLNFGLGTFFTFGIAQLLRGN
jgi:protein involved in polysaccharide export with SLBB domain